MSFLDKLKEVRENLQEKAQDGLKAASNATSQISEKAGTLAGDLKSKIAGDDAMARAAMAICTTVAYADGVLDPSEREKIHQYISTTTWSGTNDEKVAEIFEGYSERFSFDVNVGRQEAIKVIEAVKDRDGIADLVWVGAAIAKSDDVITDDEKKALKIIVLALGLDEADFSIDDED